MKKIYLFSLALLLATVFNFQKANAGVISCDLAADVFSYTSATECSLGGVFVIYSGTTTFDGSAYFTLNQEGGFIGDGFLTDGFVIIADLAPGNYDITIYDGADGNAFCSQNYIFSVEPFVCDIDDGTIANGSSSFSKVDILGSGCGGSGSINVNVTGSTCDFINFHYTLVGANTGTNLIGTDDGFGIIGIDQLAADSYVLNVSGNPDVGNSTCVLNYSFDITEPTCDMAINGLSSTNPSAPGCSDGALSFTVSGTSCFIPGPGGVSFYDVTVSQGGNVIATLTPNFPGDTYDLSGLPAGTYDLSASNGGGTCAATTSVELTTACNFFVSVTNTTPSVGAADGSVTFNVDGATCGDRIINITPTGGSTSTYNGVLIGSNMYSSLAAGTYSVILYSDANSCSAVTSFEITGGGVSVPSTTVRSQDCGQTHFVKTSSIFCNTVASATQYEWQFSDVNGVYATKITALNSIPLHSVSPVLGWGTSWSVQVRAYIGANVGTYGSICTIGIIADPAIAGVPTTTLRSQDCNKMTYTYSPTNNRIIANLVFGASQYEFEFTNNATTVVTNRVQNLNTLFLNNVTPALTAPGVYTVRVRAFLGGVWGDYGATCQVGIASFARIAPEAQEELIYDNIGNVIGSVENTFNLTSMPNPFNNEISLTFNSSSNEIVNVRIMDLTGQLIEELRISTNQKFQVGANYANGIYMVNAINNAGKQLNSKIIKNN